MQRTVHMSFASFQLSSDCIASHMTTARAAFGKYLSNPRAQTRIQVQPA